MIKPRTVVPLVSLSAMATLVGCAGSSDPGAGDSPTVLPNVVGQRLDLAESRLDDASIDYEEIGGGTFGVVDASNWVVCQTDPVPGSETANVKLVVDRSCPDESADKPKTASATKQRTRQQSWTMPDLRGKNLQFAQDAIQALTDDAIWYTSSHDATGQDRSQILDRGWTVCTQNVAPGTRITADADIDFGVVRDTESCP
jgi:hypothetical protein